MDTGFFVVMFTSLLAGSVTVATTFNARKTNELYRVRMARRAAKRRIAERRIAPAA